MKSKFCGLSNGYEKLLCMCSRTRENNKNKAGPVIWDTLYDCLYVVGCTKCPYQYIGKAVGRKLTTRWGEHRGYVNRKQLDKTTGEHFNSKGHSVANMTFTGLEQCMNEDPEYLGKRAALTQKIWRGG